MHAMIIFTFIVIIIIFHLVRSPIPGGINMAVAKVTASEVSLIVCHTRDMCCYLEHNYINNN